MITKNNTLIFTHDGVDDTARKEVMLHNTVIVTHYTKTNKVMLNNGGWYSVTTKRRMNEVSDEWDLGFSVFQKKGVWYVASKNKEEVEYYNYMEFDV